MNLASNNHECVLSPQKKLDIFVANLAFDASNEQKLQKQ